MARLFGGLVPDIIRVMFAKIAPLQLRLIVGRPGVGKTTLVRKLVESVGLEHCVGFYTNEMREGGVRRGFQWQTFDRSSGILADLSPGSPRIGKYRVWLDSFEEMLRTLKRTSPEKILIVDEVGKMECLSPLFRNLILEMESWPNWRFFTVPLYGTPFIENFKKRHAPCMVKITESNRDHLLEKILQNVIRNKDHFGNPR